ncbi:MAG: XisH family protein [Acidobacteria bacterium]|nr:XisH family protein [Acidobacteriota bacterium]
MPARDFYHDIVKRILINDGWDITHDPYPLKLGQKDLFIDLGAEKILAAEKGSDKIAVEIKSFVGRSVINDAENALGQYLIYRKLLMRKDSERILFMAIDNETLVDTLSDELKDLLIKDFEVKFLVFDKNEEKIVLWQR